MPYDGSPAASWAAAARLRTVPPIPVSRPPSSSHEARAIAAATCSRSALVCLRLARPPSGRKRSVMRTAPSGHERAVDRLAVLDARELHRAAAEIEHDALGERRRVDRGEVAVARLLRSRQSTLISNPERLDACFRNSSWLEASRIADVATARIASIPVARQKCA